MRVVRASGRVEPSRRHGPFDPRFRHGPIATERVGPVSKTSDAPEPDTMQVWESEGGALQPSPIS
jgi:hypothetical protein